ncbi:hypothetical protein IG631_12254 [Alternaria alternata]|nr:hypothetical protein IG631_12254 [Alternaria alternata]
MGMLIADAARFRAFRGFVVRSHTTPPSASHRRSNVWCSLSWRKKAMDDETQMRLCQLNVTFSMDMLARAGGRGAMKLQLRSTVSAGSMHGRLGRRRLV